MNKIKILTVINSIFLLSIIVFMIFYFFEENSNKDFYYVDNIELFNKFNMTKDIKTMEEKKLMGMKIELDSLYGIYQNLDDKKSDKAKSLQIQINSKNANFQSVQNNYTTNLSQKVWERLNNYIAEYSKTNDINIVFGTSGNGSIMYAKDDFNITEKILEFANKKYEGN